MELSVASLAIHSAPAPLSTPMNSASAKYVNAPAPRPRRSSAAVANVSNISALKDNL
jgi:hypothetical protein